MEKAIQQTYYLQDEFVSIPSDGSPLKITKKQYHNAIRILKQEGKYIPSVGNPNGDSCDILHRLKPTASNDHA